jgi:predicted acyl esterase
LAARRSRSASSEWTRWRAILADNRALLAEWFGHPTYDDYWRAEDCTLHIAKMNVPCFTIGSWYDFMSVGLIESFDRPAASGRTRFAQTPAAVLGPWLHGGLPKGNKIGEPGVPRERASTRSRTGCVVRPLPQGHRTTESSASPPCAIT